MATENGVNKTWCIKHNKYYTKQFTQNVKPAEFPLLQSDTESRHT